MFFIVALDIIAQLKDNCRPLEAERRALAARLEQEDRALAEGNAPSPPGSRNKARALETEKRITAAR